MTLRTDLAAALAIGAEIACLTPSIRVKGALHRPSVDERLRLTAR